MAPEKSQPDGFPQPPQIEDAPSTLPYTFKTCDIPSLRRLSIEGPPPADVCFEKNKTWAIREVVWLCDGDAQPVQKLLFLRAPNVKKVKVTCRITATIVAGMYSSTPVRVFTNSTLSTLAPLAHSLEDLVIHIPCFHAYTIYINSAVGFAKFTALKRLDAPGYFFGSADTAEAVTPSQMLNLLLRSIEPLNASKPTRDSSTPPTTHYRGSRKRSLTTRCRIGTSFYCLRHTQAAVPPPLPQWISTLIQKRHQTTLPRLARIYAHEEPVRCPFREILRSVHVPVPPCPTGCAEVDVKVEVSVRVASDYYFRRSEWMSGWVDDYTTT